MAKLGSFKKNSAAMQEGEWIAPGEEYEDLEIQIRGFTDQYLDAQKTRLRRAAASMGGDTTKLPLAMTRSINVECLIQHLLLGVRNLKHDDGREVSLAEFQGMLRDPDYEELMLACFKAAAQVGQRRQAEFEEAEGNSAAPSSSNSNGANTPT